eukprot:3550570-Prymnesium_polylepis.1
MFKLVGSASGEQMAHVLREKAIEGLVEDKLKNYRSIEREAKTSSKEVVDLANANEGLQMLLDRGLETLGVKHLSGILKTHKRKPTGNKDHMQQQLLDLVAQ